MNPYTTLFVGLDVHKEFIAIAYVPDDRTADITYVGPIGTHQSDIDKLIQRLQAKASRLIFAYEAGPSGYGLYRYLRTKGYACLSCSPIPHLPAKLGTGSRRAITPRCRATGPSNEIGRSELRLCSLRRR